MKMEKRILFRLSSIIMLISQEKLQIRMTP
jgi:hypothetical protein